jgi:type VI secretion system secreted protein Hcp
MRIAILAASALALMPLAVLAAPNAYLQVDGVRGASSDLQHQGWIEVLSFSFGVESPRDVASGVATGRRVHSPVRIVRLVDSTSPLLMQRAASGAAPSAAVIEAPGLSGATTVYHLSDVLVTSVRANPGSRPPTETVTLSYGRIETTTRP